MSMHSVQGPASMPDATPLASRLPQKVLVRTDSQYDAARAAWNLAVDQHPHVIVFAENPLDVIEAVTFANNHDLPIAVQATGHGLILNADDAVLINTARMKDLRINPTARTAWVGAGVKWGEVLAQAQQHGLAPLLGSSPDVGAVGYTLGGGMGWLARKYGMSADSVLRLEVVTPDGVFRRSSAEENSDLFWALRGGGGGFGVVTGMEIRLHPVTEVYAGNLFYPPELAGEVIRRFRQWVAGAPDELTAGLALMNFPPMPGVPPMLSGKSFIIVRGCYCGPMDEGQKLLAYWRDWQPPVLDAFGPMPFTNAAEISQDPLDPIPTRNVGGWLRDLDDATAAALIRNTFPQGGPPAIVFTEIRHAGGAIARVDPEFSAYSSRDGQFVWMSLAVPFDPAMNTAIDHQFAQLRSDLSSSLTGKLYMNFADPQDAHHRSRDGFDEHTFRRLQTIKAKYDPANRMRFGYDFSK